MTRRRLIRWAIGLVIAAAVVAYANSMVADCIERGGSRVECSIH